MPAALWSVQLAIWLFGAATIYAAGPFGTDNGWAVDNNGNVLLTSAVASQMSAGETGWIRIEMRLFGSIILCKGRPKWEGLFSMLSEQ